MNWFEIWQIIKDIVLPHIGRLVFNISFHSILGILIAVFLLVFYGKKKILSRNNKIYNIIVRVIYIPGIILGCGVFGFQFGFAHGVYKIIKLESPHIVDGIYLGTVDQIFSNNRQKMIFLTEIKQTTSTAQKLNMEFSYSILQEITERTTNSKLNSVSAYIVKKYNEEIYSAIVYGLCYSADIKFDDKLNWADFNNMIDVIMKTDVSKVEKSVKFAMTKKLQKLFYKQYKSIAASIILYWLLIMCIPLFEFFIYKMWVEKKLVPKTKLEA